MPYSVVKVSEDKYTEIGGRNFGTTSTCQDPCARDRNSRPPVQIIQVVPNAVPKLSGVPDTNAHVHTCKHAYTCPSTQAQRERRMSKRYTLQRVLKCLRRDGSTSVCGRRHTRHKSPWDSAKGKGRLGTARKNDGACTCLLMCPVCDLHSPR